MAKSTKIYIFFSKMFCMLLITYCGINTSESVTQQKEATSNSVSLCSLFTHWLSCTVLSGNVKQTPKCFGMLAQTYWRQVPHWSILIIEIIWQCVGTFTMLSTNKCCLFNSLSKSIQTLYGCQSIPTDRHPWPLIKPK